MRRIKFETILVVSGDSMEIYLGKLHLSFGRLHQWLPLRIKVSWGKGAGYIGGWTCHLRLQPLTSYARNTSELLGRIGGRAYLTPVVGCTRNGNKWLI